MKTTKEHNGHVVTVAFERDDFMGEPWKENDGHGIVSEWTSRDKRPGERVLCSDHGSRRYYDVEATIKIALRDGWDAKPYGGTPGEQAARAVEADFCYLRRWCDDQWEWVFVLTEIDGTLFASGGGIDSDSISHFEAEAFAEAFAYIDQEELEAHDAACRDIATEVAP